MRRLPSPGWILLLALALLAACGRSEAPGAPDAGSPEDAVRESLRLLRDGQFERFWQRALPPADYAHLRDDWPRRDMAVEPLLPEDRTRFETGVRRLTEPDAEKKLWADVRPVVTRFDRDYKDQMPLIAAIGQSMALTAIDQATGLTPGQKRQLREAVNIVAPWTQTVPWGDQGRAKTAIGTLVATARQAHLSTPEAFQGMPFDRSMATWSTLWQGFKRLLAVYGLSIDRSFDSVTLETLENSGGSARVKITYLLLDKPIQTDATLVLLDGRWYDSDLLQRVRDEHARLAPPAPAGSVPAMPSTVSPPPSPAGAPVADARAP